ncbi:hypothetical protein C8046_04605 [Serinibacter arcticus]|uniref:CinA C-terminal domain-containing protein n=1 Tax=Serinibacter arcticus TaxID=1655435 RepID=A0A2U1ZSY0_9MICO|nr:nicotinamide-nucleotide amidohydrolase family protein [Serinibacter arcticus]PWD50060.1 hypothetical protein C8046_04605 [Serinibacter arcticus]
MTPAVRLVATLRRQGRGLAVAESLTGGAVSAAVVDVPGASSVLIGSVTAYRVDVKVALLGVAPDVVTTHGVVSREVAAAMATGVARLLGADVAIATTGVAGPGPSDGVAAGTVVVAALVDGNVVTRRVVLGGGRAAVRSAARDLALALVLSALEPGERGAVGEVGNTEGAPRVAPSDE